MDYVAQARIGGRNRHAKRYEDMVIDPGMAARLLRQPVTTVRNRARAGELEVDHWQGDKPYFLAGKIMAAAEADQAVNPS